MSQDDHPFDRCGTGAAAGERLRAALGAAGIGTWHVDLPSGTVTLDEGMNRILGLDEAERREPVERMVARIHPDDRGRVTAWLGHAQAERGEFVLEFRVIRADATSRWVRARGRVLTDTGSVVATGAVIDITEQRRLEEHDRMLADATHVLASTTEYEQALTSVTGSLVPGFAAACHVHLQAGDALTTIGTGAPSDGALPERVAEAIRTGAPLHDGRLLLLPLRASAGVLGAISFLSPLGTFDAVDIAFANELAIRVALAVDRGRLFTELQRAHRVKDEFLATLSHELRTPLNAVLGWTRMLRRGTVPADRTGRVLETIERNAAAQMELVEELLDLSAMTAGALRLAVARVDLRDLVGGAVETVRPAAEAKDLRLSVTIDGAPEIAGDAARLRQVLWNLLANAVKFTPPGGWIRISVAETAADVEIRIDDSGPGIPRDFLRHVFEPFRQADSSSTRTVGGLGLGLAIVRHIVEAHGGAVTAQSDGPGLGSTFTVRLPGGRPPLHAAGSTGGGSLRGRRVLAVDDDESTQELVATMLLMYGVSVRTAGRAEQAMRILSDWRPDVLLTDIAMPGEDGYGLMRRVRALPSPVGTIPAVALTAYTDSQSVRHAFAAGFDAHLGKPLEPHVLADALEKVLRMRR
jgi:PAS domain S-box-containing protein